MGKAHWSRDDIDIILHVCHSAINKGLSSAAQGTYDSLMRLYLKGNNGETEIADPVAMLDGMQAVYDRLHSNEPVQADCVNLVEHSNDVLARENEILQAKLRTANSMVAVRTANMMQQYTDKVQLRNTVYALQAQIDELKADNIEANQHIIEQGLEIDNALQSKIVWKARAANLTGIITGMQNSMVELCNESESYRMTLDEIDN